MGARLNQYTGGSTLDEREVVGYCYLCSAPLTAFEVTVENNKELCKCCRPDLFDAKKSIQSKRIETALHAALKEIGGIK